MHNLVCKPHLLFLSQEEAVTREKTWFTIWIFKWHEDMDVRIWFQLREMRLFQLNWTSSPLFPQRHTNTRHIVPSIDGNKQGVKAVTWFLALLYPDMGSNLTLNPQSHSETRQFSICNCDWMKLFEVNSTDGRNQRLRDQPVPDPRSFVCHLVCCSYLIKHHFTLCGITHYLGMT